MSTFGALIKTYRERVGLSQHDLGVQAGLSPSTISRLEGDTRGPLRKRGQVLALARALRLAQDETDILLSSAGFAPSTAPEISLHPRDETLYRIAQELVALRSDPLLSAAQVRFVEESLLLVLRGARAALPLADLSVMPGGSPTGRTLSEEERYLDDLLGDYIAGRLGKGSVMPVTVLTAVARSPRWELKRRLAEALPALLEVDPTWIVPLMQALREDPPDAEWRTDIRRRVIEAAPALWRADPRAVPSLLRPREGDEAYAALATLDALAEIGDPALSSEIRGELLENARESQRPVSALYARLLDDCATDPEAAIRTIDAYRDEGDRLVRICLARVLPRLLATRPAEALKGMRFFTRQEGGHPAEHQNVRRALARGASRLIALLDSAYDEAAESLLRVLAGDGDVHIRRALCDTLSVLAAKSPKIALDLLDEYLLLDPDRFIQERAWNALRQIVGAGHERAEELCARQIEYA